MMETRTYISRVRNDIGGYDLVRSTMTSEGPCQRVVADRVETHGHRAVSTWVEGTWRHNEKCIVATLDLDVPATHHMLYPDDRTVTSDWIVAHAIDRYTDVLIEQRKMHGPDALARARDEFEGHVEYAKFYLSDNGDTTWER